MIFTAILVINIFDTLFYVDTIMLLTTTKEAVKHNKILLPYIHVLRLIMIM